MPVCRSERRSPLAHRALLAGALALVASSADAAPPCSPPPPADAARPRPAAVLHGDAERHAPLLRFEVGSECLVLELPLSLAGRVEAVSPFAVDTDGHELDSGLMLAPRARVGARLDVGRELAPLSLLAAYEHDLVTGIAAPDASIAGDGLPASGGLDHEIRKAFFRASYERAVHLSAGLMTSHWGLGLLANDGDHGWEPGSARFADPRGGDRVLRALLATGPHTGAGLVLALGADIVRDDDVTLPGDDASQLLAALTVGGGAHPSAGAYVVRRHQRSAGGAATDVWAFDLTARAPIALRPGRLTLEAEGALVSGTTGLGPTNDFPEHDVLQVGAAARATLEQGPFGVVIDFLYASGDQNLDDGDQNAFKADPNYDMGLLLYRHVMTGQTARGAVTAADPTLVGVPSEDLTRVPSRGSPTGTIALFPRLRYRPIDGLEAYGGPLFAFAPVAVADPLQTRFAGGAPHNALGGEGGSYLGTELDVGARYRALIAGAEVTLGVEAGALRPGSALRRADGAPMGGVYGGRATLDIRL